jgi:hypothetical protein
MKQGAVLPKINNPIQNLLNMKMLLQLPKSVKVVLTVFMLLIFAAACNESEAPNTTVPITAGSAVESPNMNIPDQYKIGGFAVGTQAYTLNRFTVFEAFEKNAAAGEQELQRGGAPPGPAGRRPAATRPGAGAIRDFLETT